MKYSLKAAVLATAVVLSLPLKSVLAQGSERRALPLAEAVQLALATSKDLKASMAAQGVARAKVAQAKNGILPTVAINSTFTRLSDNITPFRVRLPEREITLNPQILNQSYNNFQVRQVLWAGGKVRNGIAAAGRAEAAARAETDQYRLAAADNVTTIWYTLYTLNASEGLIEQNIQLLRARRRDLTNLERQGLVLKVDGLKLDLAVSQLESSLVDLRSSRAINSFDLALATGLPPTTEFIIDAELPARPPLPPLGELLTEAGAGRSELKALGLRREAAVLDQKIVRAGVMPTLAFGGNVDYNRPNQRVFPSEAAFKGTSSVFASLNFDIGGLYTNRAQVAESRYRLEQLNANIEQAQEGVQRDVNANYQAYVQATDKIRVAEQALGPATENFRVEQNRLKANVTTPTDFLAANTQLLQAQLDLRTAQANAALAYSKLLKSTGRQAQ
ncbi:TolC family protein [Hymenobacter sp. UYCo722]|uniref:TolC family protein n=1 Tax=Hymenobacter sp. UYCo722 TaxID=3156335 RepID=UPI0033982551